MKSHLLTNLESYLAIARTAQLESQRAADAARRPMPDGSPGVVVSFDPEQKSFRQSLVAIVFASVYLEALFYIEGTRKLAGAYNDSVTYEEKALALGVDDQELLAGCKRLREVRRGIVHEKATTVSETIEFVRSQDEAARAIVLIEKIATIVSSRDS